MSAVDWSQLYKFRKSVARRYKDIWSVPLALRSRYSDIMFSVKEQPMSVLEVGAGDRGLKKKIEKKWPGCSYASFDIDKNQPHDFYRLEDIKGEFDMVCMYEVIEHVSPELAVDILSKCFQHLSPGGYLLVTTPNIYYPPGFLRDATHITPWCYDELGGVASLCGFEVDKIYRLYKESIFKMFIRRVLAYPLFRLLRIDISKQIMLVARKPL